jgi:hypothetical protein
MAWPDTKRTLIGVVRKTAVGRWNQFGLLIGDEWFYGRGYSPVRDTPESVTVDYVRTNGRNELLRIESQQEDGKLETVWRRRKTTRPEWSDARDQPPT